MSPSLPPGPGPSGRWGAWLLGPAGTRPSPLWALVSQQDPGGLLNSSMKSIAAATRTLILVKTLARSTLEAGAQLQG